jgi:hypothetical protein
MLNLSTIRSLQRDHMMTVDAKLDSFSEKSPLTIPIEAANKVLTEIRRRPRQIIFEACAGSSDMEVTNPPSWPHLRAMKLKALIEGSKADRFEDDAYRAAQGTYEATIGVAVETSRTSYAVLLTLVLVRFWMRFAKESEKLKSDVLPHLEWAIGRWQFGGLDCRHSSSERASDRVWIY